MRLFEIEDSDVAATVDFIKANCKPWLSQTDNGERIVYRGIRAQGHEVDVFIRNTRSDRRPLNSSYVAHTNLNNMIAAIGGIANRSNSAFVSGRVNIAKQYGSKPFVYLPVGTFNYTWSPIWRDWFMEYDNTTFMQYAKYESLPRDENFVRAVNDVDDEIAELTHILKADVDSDNYRFHNMKTRLQHLIDNKQEVIRKEYLNRSHATVVKFEVSDFDENLVKNIIISDSGLPAAIDSENEILLSSKLGLYVDIDVYEEIRKAL